MNTRFTRKKSVCIVTFNSEGSGLDSRLLTSLIVNQFALELLTFGPAKVHPQEHLGPVLRVGSASTGVDRDDGIATVVLSAEEHLRLAFRDGFRETAERLLQFSGRSFVVCREFKKDFNIFDQANPLFGRYNDALETRALLQYLLRALLITPKIRLRCLRLQTLELRSLRLYVKETSEARNPGA